MALNIGSKYGLSRRATVRKNNGDGTIQIALDEIGLQQNPQNFTVPFPTAYAGPNGEFIGGYLEVGTSVIVNQGQGGQWFVESIIPSRGVFTDKNLMSALQPGRALIQAKGGNYLFVDKSGVQAGNASQTLHADPKHSILSNNFSANMAFTEASRSIDGPVKRDIKENSLRGMLGSTLDSHDYDDTLVTIGMDPSASVSIRTSGDIIRNPPLVEQHQINYEFADSFDFGSDTEESTKISNPSAVISKLDNGRKESRADSLSLGLQFPNHLIETTKGTVVDSFGNIVDINRNIIPIGKVDELSLRKNSDKEDAFAKIRSQLRKSVAFHFEINARKAGVEDGITPVPDVDDVTNYSRNRSRFSIDIDKEGQFKINVPSSSETGNIPLLTRHENYSNIIAKKDPSNDPNALVRNADFKDVFLENFAGKPNINLKSNDADLDGHQSPIDRFTDKPIKFGTAFHDITKACSTFLTNAPTIHLYDENPLTQITTYDKIVSDSIIVSGKDANGGGRSGSINMDGFLSLNIGANTIDRQSLWVDCAGGMVSQIGRDKNGISHAMHLDGDMIVQIGGVGIGNSYDSRFSSLNDGARIGALDIRVIDGDRPMTILRIDRYGIRLATEGVFDVTAQQGIRMNTNGQFHINGERVALFTNTGLTRIIERSGIPI